MRKAMVFTLTVAACVLMFCGGSLAQIVEDAPRMTASQWLRIYQLNQEIKAKAESVMKSDPRYTRYLADFDQLRKQARSPEFRERSAEFRKKYEQGDLCPLMLSTSFEFRGEISCFQDQ